MRPLLLVAAACAFVVALFVAQHTPSQGPPLRDFEAYYAGGQTWRYQGDPYSRDVWRGERLIPGVDATRDELLPFVGPPYGLPLWSVFGNLSFRGASLVWAVVLGASFTTLALGGLIAGIGRLSVVPTLAVLCFAAAFSPLTGGIALGQVAIVACAAIVAFPATLRPRGTLAATALALVAGLQPNLAFVLAARASDARARIAIVIAALVAFCGSALALGGLGGIAHYASVLRDHGAAERFIAIQTTPGAVAYALGAPPVIASALAISFAAIVIVVLAVQCTRHRYAPNDRLLLASAAVPLALPFAHAHDYAIAFVPAIVLVLRARGAAWAWSACAALALAVDWLGLAQRPEGVASAVALALAATCALAALAPGRLDRIHAIPLAIVALVVVAARITVTHRLPIWPDALPAGFSVAAKLPAAVVWHAEQVASGIAERDPVWGALRAVGSIACVILWVVASVELRTVAHRDVSARQARRSQRSEASSTPRPERAVNYPYV